MLPKTISIAFMITKIIFKKHPKTFITKEVSFAVNF